MNFTKKGLFLASVLLSTQLVGVSAHAQPQSSNPIPNSASTSNTNSGADNGASGSSTSSASDSTADSSNNQQQQRVGTSGSSLPWWVPVSTLVVLAFIGFALRNRRRGSGNSRV